MSLLDINDKSVFYYMFFPPKDNYLKRSYCDMSSEARLGSCTYRDSGRLSSSLLSLRSSLSSPSRSRGVVDPASSSNMRIESYLGIGQSMQRRKVVASTTPVNSSILYVDVASIYKCMRYGPF